MDAEVAQLKKDGAKLLIHGPGQIRLPDYWRAPAAPFLSWYREVRRIHSFTRHIAFRPTLSFPAPHTQGYYSAGISYKIYLAKYIKTYIIDERP